MLVLDTVEVVVQVNGRIRDRLHVAPDLGEHELVALARGIRAGTQSSGRRRGARTIVVPGRLVNFVHLICVRWRRRSLWRTSFDEVVSHP